MALLRTTLLLALGALGCVARSDVGATPVAGSRIEVTPQAIAADGNERATIDIFVQDGAGNPLAGAEVTLDVPDELSVVQALRSTDANGHTASFVTGYVSGDFLVHANVRIGATLLRITQGASLKLQPSAGAHDNQLRIVVSPPAGSVDDTAERIVAVSLQSASGTPIANAAIELRTDSSLSTLLPTTGVTDVTGRISARLVRTASGSATILATGPQSTTAQTTVQFVAGAPDAAHTYFLIQAGNALPADGVTDTPAVVFVGDKFGNPVPYAPVALSASSSDLTIEPSNGPADSSGVFRTNLVSADLGNTTLQARSGSAAVAKPISLVPGAASANTSLLTVSPNLITADGAAAASAQLQLRDAAGHPLLGQNVLWSSPAATANFTPASAQTDLTGMASTAVSSERSGPIEIVATSGLLSLTTGLLFISGAPNAVISSLAFAPTQTVADANANTRVVFVANDAFGNPVAGASVTYSASDANITIAPNTVVTGPDGVAAAWLSSIKAGQQQVCAQFGNLYTLCANLTTIANAPNTALSNLTLTPNHTVVGSNVVASVKLVDRYKNPAANNTWSIAGVQGLSLAAATAPTDGTGQASVAFSSTVAQTLAVSVSNSSASPGAMLTLQPGPVSPQYSSLAFSSNSATADGQTSVSYTGRVADAFNNTIQNQNLSLVPLFARSAAMRYSTYHDKLYPGPVFISNGATGQPWPLLPGGNAYVNWQISPMQPLFLRAGINALGFTPGPGAQDPVNVDYFTVSKGDQTDTFEAEATSLSGAAFVDTAVGGYLGTGYVSMSASTNDTLSFVYPSVVAGGNLIVDANVLLGVRYNGSGVSLAISVNGASSGNIWLPTLPSIEWSTTAWMPLPAQVGNNTIALQLQQNTVLIDQVYILRRGATQRLEAETGTYFGGAQSEATWGSWSGSGYAAYMYANSMGVVVNPVLGADGFAPGNAISDANGQFTGSWSSSIAEPKMLSVTAGNTTLQANVVFTAGPAAALANVLVAPNPPAAGSVFYVLAKAVDTQQNPVQGAVVAIQGNNVLGGMLTSDSQGYVMAPVAATTYLSSQTYCAMTGNIATRCVTVPVVAGAANAVLSSLSVSQNSIVAGGNVQIAAAFVDKYSNPLSGSSYGLQVRANRYVGFRFSNGGSTVRDEVATIDGVQQANYLVYPATGAWSNYAYTQTSLLPVGALTSTLKLFNLHNACNLDYLSLSAGDATQFYEAEAGALANGAALASSANGYSGAGYIQLLKSTGASVSVPLSVWAGNQNSYLQLRYSAASAATNVSVSVNGNGAISQYLAQTLADNDWQLSPALPFAPLNGNNQVVIAAQSVNILLDQVLVVMRGPSQMIEAETGAVAGGAVVASNYAGYSGTGFIANLNTPSASVSIPITLKSEQFASLPATLDSQGRLSTQWASAVADNKWLTVSAGNLTLSAPISTLAGAPSGSTSFVALTTNTLIAGNTLKAVAFARDAYSNAVSNTNVVWTTSLGSNGLGAATSVTDARGASQITFSPTLAGARQLCAQIGPSLTQCANVLVSAGAPNAAMSSLNVVAGPAVAGATFAFNQSVHDLYGNPVVAQLENFVLSSSGQPNVVYGGYTDAGGNVAWARQLTAAGNYTVSGVGALAGLSAALVVSPNAAYTVVVNGVRKLPAGLINDISLSVVDLFGNVTPSYAGQVNVVIDDPYASAPNHSFIASDAGRASFPGSLVSYTPGTRVLSVSGNNLAPSAANFVVDQAILRPIKLKLVSASPNVCLSAQGGNAIVGQNVVLAPCNAHLSQVVSLGSDNTFRLGNRCLTLGAGMSVGSSVTLQFCGNFNAQKWQFAGARITSVNNPNVCLGPLSPATNATLGAVACGGGNVDVFVPEKRTGGYTLAVLYWQNLAWTAGYPNFSGSDFNRLSMQGFSANLAVYPNANDQLMLSPNMCLDVQGQVVQTGANITAYPCQDVPSQKWIISQSYLSPLSNPGLCALRPSSVGMPFTLAACNQGGYQLMIPIEYGLYAQAVTANANGQQMCLSMNSQYTPVAGTSTSPNNRVQLSPCQHSNLQVITVAPFTYSRNDAAQMRFSMSTSGSWSLEQGSQGNLVYVTGPATSVYYAERWWQWGVPSSPGSVLLNEAYSSLNLDTNSGLVPPAPIAASQSWTIPTQWWYFDTIPMSWSPQSQTTQCFSVSGGNASLGQPVTIRACSPNMNQQFMIAQTQNQAYAPTSTTIVFDGLCLDSSSGTAAGGTAQMNVCQATPSQQWSFGPSTLSPIVNQSGWCLDTTTSGSPNSLGVNSCNGSVSQNFTLIIK